jgi:uncharacterized protein
MIPISSFILKTTSVCNLDCRYCYMFNLQDTSFKRRPNTMPSVILNSSIASIYQYAVNNDIRNIHIIFHGGEPLLAGRDWFREAVSLFRSTGVGQVDFTFSVQTNGVLLDTSWIDLFKELRIAVSISMDGPRHIHDRARVYHGGRGSYDDVVRGLRLLIDTPDSNSIFGGVLCVVDPSEQGIDTYQHFRSLGVKRLDFLLPLEFNWDNLPPNPVHGNDTPYADYLIPIFDSWWSEDDPGVNLRFAKDIVCLLMGSRHHIDALGGDAVALGVIEADGSIEPLDALRACGDGFTNLGLNILTDPINNLYDRPLFQTVMMGQDGLCAECRDCPLHDVCGAGYLPNRFGNGRGFDNPSVYCRDLWKLILHITNAVRSRIASTAVSGPPIRSTAAI